MSASIGARVRRFPHDFARHVALLGFSSLLAATLVAGIASADVPSAAVRIGAAQLAGAGGGFRLDRHAVGRSTLVEVALTGPVSKGSGAPPTLLAVSPAGDRAAMAEGVGELSGSLILAREDGSQLRIQLPGLLAAGYAVDGSWLAVIDGHGALWQVDADDGSVVQRAVGPFLGTPIAAADGSLLLLAVPSVEAPYRSQLVRIEPATGNAAPLTTDGLVYGGFPLADGTIAVVVHEAGHSVVRVAGSGGGRQLADLGPDAVNVAVAPDGGRIAFEIVGRGIFLVERGGLSPGSLGPGSRPCFAPDGSSLLVRRGTGTAALRVDGTLLASTDQPAGFAGAVGCLP